MTEKEKVSLPLKNLNIKPLTKKELHKTAVERVHLISKEFTDGFNFLQKFSKSVTFFGGSHFKEGDTEYETARALANKIVTELGYCIVTGGGPGIMEAANRGSHEAGGVSVGLTIELPEHLVQNVYVNQNLNFHYFFSRKVCLVFSAEAYIVFPGGFGTFDEFFEILTLVQTNKIERAPIVLVGTKFWTPFYEVIKNEMLSRGAIDQDDLDLFVITDDLDQVLQIVKDAPVRNGIDFKHDEEEV